MHYPVALILGLAYGLGLIAAGIILRRHPGLLGPLHAPYDQGAEAVEEYRLRFESQRARIATRVR